MEVSPVRRKPSSPFTDERKKRSTSCRSPVTTPNSAVEKKRYKTTGQEFLTRKLTYYDDKVQTNDEIHGSIELDPVTKALVDTEVFQRLRHVRQLGTTDQLYGCANGNRFQHSLGVAHLAAKMCKTIKEEQPNLRATDKDVLCVKLAGLLHDVGHGPYSHIYEAFRDRALPKFLDANPHLEKYYEDCQHLQVPDDWSHEQSSLVMIDAALKEIGLAIDLDHLDKPLKQIGDGIDAESMRVFKPPEVDDAVLTSRDFIFINECILGKPLEEVVEKYGNKFIGRTQAKQEWLYDIVNNRHSGLDVDKCDYFARDERRTKGSGSVDNKLIEDARVARARCARPDKCVKCKETGEAGEHYMICYPRKHVDSSMNFFKNRLHLHTIVYQHKKTVAAESMLCDILCEADPFFRLETYDGEAFPISRAILKSEFLLRLDDSIIDLIAHSKQAELAKARELCRRYRRHDFYKCAVEHRLDLEGDWCGEVSDDEDDDDFRARELARQDSERDQLVNNMSEHEIEAGMLRLKKHQDGSIFKDIEPDDFIIKKYSMHHGSKNNNPLRRMRFFEKMNESLIGPLENLPEAKAIKEPMYRSIIPRSLEKNGIRVYCRSSKKRDVVGVCFHTWLNSLGRDEDGAMTTNFFDDNNVGVDHDEDDMPHQQSNILSQDSIDEDDDYRNDDDNHQNQFEMASPIPTHRHR